MSGNFGAWAERNRRPFKARAASQLAPVDLMETACQDFFWSGSGKEKRRTKTDPHQCTRTRENLRARRDSNSRASSFEGKFAFFSARSVRVVADRPISVIREVVSTSSTADVQP